MNWSIIITTRERRQLLWNLIGSIKLMTNDLSKVEVHVAYDEDDFDTESLIQDEIQKRSEEFKYIFWHKRPRSTWMHRDYINWCALNFCSGKYVLSLNDDTLFATKDWDIIAFNKLEDYLKNKPDGVVYGSIDDSLPEENKVEDRQYCCFPIISMRSIKALGFMFDNEFKAWNADIAIYYVYKKLGRILDLKEMRIEHLSHHNGKRERDSINYGVETISSDRFSPETFVDRDCEILKEYAKRFYE